MCVAAARQKADRAIVEVLRVLLHKLSPIQLGAHCDEPALLIRHADGERDKRLDVAARAARHHEDVPLVAPALVRRRLWPRPPFGERIGHGFEGKLARDGG